MKRFLAFLCTLMLLLQPVGGVHAEGETSSTDLPQCAACGDNVQFTQMIDAEGGHVMACPHGVVDESSFQAHQYEWVSDETNHWQQCTVGMETMGDHEAHYANCDASNPNVCAVCGKEAAGMTVIHGADWKPDNNDVEHWYVCSSCKEEIPDSRSPHYDNCKAPGVCERCGATYPIESISHRFGRFDHNDTEHWTICGVCGEEIPDSRYPHMNFCTDDKTCGTCGADFVGGSPAHTTDGIYQHNETEHWQVCSACNQTVYRSNHIEMCTKPGKCAACGIDFVSENMSHVGPLVLNTSATEHWNTCPSCKKEIPYSRRAHYGNAECSKETHACELCQTEYVPERLQHTYSADTLKYNDEGHWYECPDCGAMLTSNGGINPHTASCTDPTHCSCGATFTPEPWQITHSYNNEYQSDATYHWKVCADCGVIIEHDVHWVDCTNPSVCWDCGATVTVEDWQIMHGDNEGYQSNETEHWLICPDCGEEVDRFEHEARCTAPGKCLYCGYEDPNIKIGGHDEITTYSDADKHWFVCDNCGETLDEEEHYAMCDSPNKCVEGCGTKDEINIGSISHGYVAADYESDGTNH